MPTKKKAAKKAPAKKAVKKAVAKKVVAKPAKKAVKKAAVKKVAKKAGSVLKGFKDCGCLLDSPNMQLSLLALVVIPELRISDLGLVDVTRFSFTSALE